MRYSKISSESEIVLKAEIISGNTPSKAIKEAIEFVKEHDLRSIYLNYGNFCMYIDAESDIQELVIEYNAYSEIRKVQES